MKDYVEKNLQKNEKIIIRAKHCKIVPIIMLVLGILIAILALLMLIAEPAIGIIFLAFSLLLIVMPILTIKNMTLVVTNKRVMGKYGILNSKSFDYPIEKIGIVQVKTTLLGMIFKYKVINISNDELSAQSKKFFAPKRNSTEQMFKYITNANEVKNAITSAIDSFNEEKAKMQAQYIADAMSKENTTK